jgi:hypothetical protein
MVFDEEDLALDGLHSCLLSGAMRGFLTIGRRSVFVRTFTPGFGSWLRPKVVALAETPANNRSDASDGIPTV